MIIYLYTSVFSSPAQTLVNTVNTVGVMGKGIAKEFKNRYPKMFNEYRKLCDDRRLSVGQLHLWRGEGSWVLNFPTKTTWRRPSEMQYVERGLQKFVSTYKDLGVTSISFPPLGCGNGNLAWADVQPIMHHYLSRCEIPIFIHNVQVGSDFVPEHKSDKTIGNFEDFLTDIRVAIEKNNGRFSTSKGAEFEATVNEFGDVKIRKESGKTEVLGEEILSKSYSRLNDAILLSEVLSGSTEKRQRSYLFPILSSLPYVTTAKVSSDDRVEHETRGLFVDRSRKRSALIAGGESQGCLFQ